MCRLSQDSSRARGRAARCGVRVAVAISDARGMPKLSRMMVTGKSNSAEDSVEVTSGSDDRRSSAVILAVILALPGRCTVRA